MRAFSPGFAILPKARRIIFGCGWQAIVVVLVAIAAAGCGQAGDGPGGSHAMAATMPAPVAAATAEVVVEPPEPTVLDLEPVDGMAGGVADEQAAVKELPGPSTRRPACLVAGDACAFGKDAWVETREGFVTRWAMLAITDAKQKKEADPALLLAQVGARMQALVVAGPVIELAPDGKLEGKAPAPVWLLATRVFAARAQPARLMLSLNGAVRVALNGKTVHEERGDQYMLVDHRTVSVALVAGWNTFAVRLEKLSPYAVKLAMRLRAADGQPLTGLAWGLPGTVSQGDRVGGTGGANATCEALATTIAPHWTATGWSVKADVAAHGLLPWPLPHKVELRVGTSTVAVHDFDGDATSRELEAEVPEGPSTVAVAVDGVVCGRLDLRAISVRARYLAAWKALAAIDPKRLGPGDRESLDYQFEDVRGLLEAAASGEAPRRLEGALQHLETHVHAIAAGRKPFDEPGLHVRAYRSDYDGKLQRYLVIVPKVYARGDAAPLVMLAHGLDYTPEDMLRIALAKPSGPGEALRSGAIYRWDPPEPPSGAILVAHDGYGNAGQRAPGEVDVRRVIDEMKAAYRIDPRRVSISGFSLGGSVAFWVPFHAPSVFSAAAPLCGYPNILEYRSVKAAVKKPWEARLLDEDGVAPYAEGGKYLPLKMVHGALDGPSRSELLHNRYKTLRYPSELDIPQLGHNVWDKAFEDGTLLKWLAARRRPAVAPQPVVRSGRYRWGTNYWLAIERFEDDAQFGQLDGSFKGDRIQVATRNVGAFSILGRELGERAQKPQTFVIDGRNLGEHVVGPGGALHLARGGGQGWSVTPTVDRAAYAKRPGLEGPIGDAWYGPLIVVYGTQVPAELEVNRLTAERLSMHAPWIDLRVPVLADVAVTEADLVGRSVVLVGRPATNLLTARAAPALEAAGIRFTDHALEVDGRHFEGPEVGISVIRPSPFDPNRYLVLHAGLGPDGTLSARYLPELSPDYLVYDSRMRAVFGDRILGPREALMGGFFDSHWALTSDAPR